MQRFRLILTCTFCLVITACDQSSDSVNDKEVFEQVEIEQQQPQVEVDKDQVKEPQKQEIHQVIKKVEKSEEPEKEKSVLDLDLEIADMPLMDDPEPGRHPLTNKDPVNLFHQALQDASREQPLDITSDVIFADENDDTGLMVEDIIRQIDGAEVNLEYKF